MLLGVNHDGRQEGLEEDLGGWRVESQTYEGCKCDLSLGGVKLEAGGCYHLRKGDQCGLGKEIRGVWKTRTKDPDQGERGNAER